MSLDMFRKIVAEFGKAVDQELAIIDNVVQVGINDVGFMLIHGKDWGDENMLVSCDFGEVPKDRETLVTLPGVGRKTANVVMNCAFGEETFAVDTHVFRVANRLGLAKSDNVDEVERQLMKRIPKEKWTDAHHWLIWHGRRLCSARSPQCGACPLQDLCRYAQAEAKKAARQKPAEKKGKAASAGKSGKAGKGEKAAAKEPAAKEPAAKAPAAKAPAAKASAAKA